MFGEHSDIFAGIFKRNMNNPADPSASRDHYNLKSLWYKCNSSKRTIRGMRKIRCLGLTSRTRRKIYRRRGGGGRRGEGRGRNGAERVSEKIRSLRGCRARKYVATRRLVDAPASNASQISCKFARLALTRRRVGGVFRHERPWKETCIRFGVQVRRRSPWAV